MKMPGLSMTIIAAFGIALTVTVLVIVPYFQNLQQYGTPSANFTGDHGIYFF
jgi:hypothetical protein